MPKEYSRIDRLSELMQREIAALIQFEMKDPRLGMVTVSGVEITSDLAYAKVFVTVFGTEQEIANNIKLLNRAAGFFRSQLAKKIKLRKMPELTFVYDRVIAEGRKLSDLIDKVVAEDESKARKRGDE